MQYLRENNRHQVAAGLNVSLLTPADVAHLAPELRHDVILGGSFCPTDGFVDPHSVMTGFMLKAAERGVRLMRDTLVTGITRDARGVTGVETSRGFIAGRTVVNAAGAWAGGVAKLAGLDLPVEPLRRMLVPTEPFDRVAHTSPMVVDMSTGFHYRPDGRGLLLDMPDTA
jgi:sarcosine oxidase subunit beta